MNIFVYSSFLFMKKFPENIIIKYNNKSYIRYGKVTTCSNNEIRYIYLEYEYKQYSILNPNSLLNLTYNGQYRMIQNDINLIKILDKKYDRLLKLKNLFDEE